MVSGLKFIVSMTVEMSHYSNNFFLKKKDHVIIVLCGKSGGKCIKLNFA